MEEQSLKRVSAARERSQMAKASTAQSTSQEPSEKEVKQRAPKREIEGNLPYTRSPGVLKRVLEQIPVAARPAPTFTLDFLSTVLGASGGSSRPIIPFLKKAGFLDTDGKPTELYDRFRTQSGRGSAALQGLRNAFETIFRHNAYAHRTEENQLRDIVVRITGLGKTDSIVSAILGTFAALKAFVTEGAENALVPIPEPESTQERKASQSSYSEKEDVPTRNLGISYNINIGLPESTNIEVYDAIFRSLRDNLLR